MCRTCAGELGPDQDRLPEAANGRILEMLARTKEMIPLDILFCELSHNGRVRFLHTPHVSRVALGAFEQHVFSSVGLVALGSFFCHATCAGRIAFERVRLCSENNPRVLQLKRLSVQEVAEWVGCQGQEKPSAVIAGLRSTLCCYV